MTTTYIGQPISRVDGPAKVTGQAKYAGEYHVPNLAYGVVVSSAIAKGRIAKIDTSDALSLEGVIHIFTHENAPSTAWLDRSYRDDLAPPGSPFHPLKNDRVLFSGQPVALVVADTLELARYAATLVDIEYRQEPHATDLARSETRRTSRRRGKYPFHTCAYRCRHHPTRVGNQKGSLPMLLCSSKRNTRRRLNITIRWNPSQRP